MGLVWRCLINLIHTFETLKKQQQQKLKVQQQMSSEIKIFKIAFSKLKNYISSKKPKYFFPNVRKLFGVVKNNIQNY